jgi:acyl-coenzyme A synthetase/AMP-(fatty) acid ligase
MHIVDMVYFWARTIPMHPAVMLPTGSVTYASLARSMDSAARYFAEAVPDKSKPVAISIHNGSKLVIALLGLLRAGFDVVLANKGVFPNLGSAGVSTLVIERDTAAWDGGTNLMFDDNWLNIGIKAEKYDKPYAHAPSGGGNIICFTSGTTGRPKIVVCPQSSWQHRVLFPLNSVFSHYERMLVVPGLVTSWGFSRAYEALHSGRTVCLAPPGLEALWMANTYDIDTILVSPQQALELAEIQEKRADFPLTALKSVQIGAASMNGSSVRRIQNSLCRNVIMIYGSTEAGVAALAPYDMVGGTDNAVGYVMPGVEVEIVDAVDHPMPRGKEGFVRVRSQVFALNMAASGAVEEWFYPGDLGWLTENNLLCITGRGSDVVNRGGHKLSITDVEEFLRSCFGVQDAGACTVAGEAGFSQVWAALVLQPAADMAALRHAIESNAEFKNNIDKIFVVETVPRGTLGKVQRDELKKMLQSIGEQ